MGRYCAEMGTIYKYIYIYIQLDDTVRRYEYTKRLDWTYFAYSTRRLGASAWRSSGRTIASCSSSPADVVAMSDVVVATGCDLSAASCL